MKDDSLRCSVCGEILKVKAEMTQTEIEDAVTGFMVEHVDKHGGDPSTVLFTVPLDGVMMRCTT